MSNKKLIMTLETDLKTRQYKTVEDEDMIKLSRRYLKNAETNLPKTQINTNGDLDDDEQKKVDQKPSGLNPTFSEFTVPLVVCLNFMEEEKKYLNSELWHACSSPLVSLPAVGSRVVYFPKVTVPTYRETDLDFEHTSSEERNSDSELKQLEKDFKKDIGQATGLLRMHFHDCFVQVKYGVVKAQVAAFSEAYLQRSKKVKKDDQKPSGSNPSQPSKETVSREEDKKRDAMKKGNDEKNSDERRNKKEDCAGTKKNALPIQIQ
ncbi:hypothetical protein AgCh_012808 [Apium graveolens]